MINIKFDTAWSSEERTLLDQLSPNDRVPVYMSATDTDSIGVFVCNTFYPDRCNPQLINVINDCIDSDSTQASLPSWLTESIRRHLGADMRDSEVHIVTFDSRPRIFAIQRTANNLYMICDFVHTYSRSGNSILDHTHAPQYHDDLPPSPYCETVFLQTHDCKQLIPVNTGDWIIHFTGLADVYRVVSDEYMKQHSTLVGEE